MHYFTYTSKKILENKRHGIAVQHGASRVESYNSIKNYAENDFFFSFFDNVYGHVCRLGLHIHICIYINIL